MLQIIVYPQTNYCRNAYHQSQEVQLKSISNVGEKKKKRHFTDQSYSHVKGSIITILVSLVSKILMQDFKVVTYKENLTFYIKMSH